MRVFWFALLVNIDINQCCLYFGVESINRYSILHHKLKKKQTTKQYNYLQEKYAVYLENL